MDLRPPQRKNNNTGTRLLVQVCSRCSQSPSSSPTQCQTDSVNRETFLMSPPAHLHIYEDRRWKVGWGRKKKKHKGANYNVVSTQQRLFSFPHLPSSPSRGKSFASTVQDLGVSSVCLLSIFMRQSTGRGDCLLWWCADQRTVGTVRQ